MTNQNYEFVHNMVTGKYQVMSRMVKDAKYRKYTDVSDDILHSIWMKMDLKGIHTSVQKLWVNPHYVNQSMLILVGKGGIYKTTILGALLPPCLKTYYLNDSTSNYLDKDAMEAQATKASVNLDEFCLLYTSDAADE